MSGQISGRERKRGITLDQKADDQYEVKSLKNTTGPNKGDRLNSREVDEYIRLGYDVTIK